MRALKLLLAFLVAGSLNAQTFEGTIRWTMKMEISDPRMKAEMEQAKDQLNDPETQEAMKEMQEKMNSPEIKKMMESNPQMKAAMESAMKSAARGGAPEGMDAMMPKGMTIKIKGENMVSIMEGGMEVLQVKDKPVTRVNRAEKTYTPMPEPKGESMSNKVKVTKTSETAKILGYSCVKYVAEIKEQGATMKQSIWATTEIKDMNMKSLARQRIGQGGQSMFYDQIEGVPLRVESATPQGNMTMEATEIKREKLADSDFMIPADFKVAKMPGGF